MFRRITESEGHKWLRKHDEDYTRVLFETIDNGHKHVFKYEQEFLTVEKRHVPDEKEGYILVWRFWLNTYKPRREIRDVSVRAAYYNLLMVINKKKVYTIHNIDVVACPKRLEIVSLEWDIPAQEKYIISLLSATEYLVYALISVMSTPDCQSIALKAKNSFKCVIPKHNIENYVKRVNKKIPGLISVGRSTRGHVAYILNHTIKKSLS